MKNLLIICGLLIIFSSCYNDKADKLYVQPTTTTTCDTSNVTYSAIVNPIIQNSCANSSSCHNAAGAALSGYDFTSYSGLQRAAVSGNLIPAIQHAGSLPYMPLNQAKLADCDIQKIVIWINAGALQN
jgi:cytochrome c553